MVDDETHDARVAVLGRVSDQRKTADHFAFHEITVCAAGSVFPLRCEDFVVIAAIGNGFIARLVLSVTLASCPRRKWTERALFLARLRFPVKAVFLSRVAPKFLRVFEKSLFTAHFHGVFTLGVDVG